MTTQEAVAYATEGHAERGGMFARDPKLTAGGRSESDGRATPHRKPLAVCGPPPSGVRSALQWRASPDRRGERDGVSAGPSPARGIEASAQALPRDALPAPGGELGSPALNP